MPHTADPVDGLHHKFYQSLDLSIAVFPYLGSVPSSIFCVLRDCSSVVRRTVQSKAENLSGQGREAYVPKYN